MNKELTQKSKFISLILRHKPSSANLTLDENGWADIPSLLSGAAQNGIALTRDELIEIVDTNEKRRFVICPDTDRIRANQGHSINVDLELEQATPPDPLFHGTTVRFENSILEKGLVKMKRHHVHLSADLDTARAVGSRHGKILIFKVDTQAMLRDGHDFYLSKNGVWLTDAVPANYLTLVAP